MKSIKRAEPLLGAIQFLLLIFLIIQLQYKCTNLKEANNTLHTIVDEQTVAITTLEAENLNLTSQLSECIEKNNQLEQPKNINLGQFKITAYCSCTKCCGQWADGATASGTTPTAGRTIAVDPSIIPLGTQVIIDGHTYTAEDTGGAIKGNKIDLYFSSHSEALNWGVKYKDVVIVE